MPPYDATQKDFALLKAADPGDADIAAAVSKLNDPDDSISGVSNLESASKGAINKWGAQTGGVLAIKTAAENASHARRAICHAAISNFENPNIHVLDLTDPEIIAMLNALTVESSQGANDSVITESVRDALLEAASVRRSWSEMNWTRPIHIGDLQIARQP
jgi:hypothetical protein